MTRRLAAVALSFGFVATLAPASPAIACQFSQCAWGQIVCSQVRCPIVCYRVPVAERTVCIAR